jgi:hypothetical protein
MIIELKQLFREARWFWVFVALTMCMGTGFRFFFRGTGGNAVIARINGQAVTQRAFSSRVQKEENYRKRLLQFGIKMGPVNPEVAFKSCLREAMLLGLAESLNIEVGDGLVAENIKKMMPKELFAKNGTLDEDAYRNILAQSGEGSVSDFEEQQREDMIRSFMSGIIQKSYFSKESEGVREKNVQRSFVCLRIKPEQIKEDLVSKGIVATEEELHAWYERNKNQFKDSGFASLKAVCINRESVGKNIVVSDKEISDYYSRYKQSKYTTKKNYTIDFWVFDQKGLEELAEDKISALRELTDMCTKKGVLENFELCEKKATQAGFKLNINRNHKIVLGEGKFSTKLENTILSVSEIGSFSAPVEIDGKVYLVRLVRKDGAVVQQPEEVRVEILATIRAKKEEYEVNRIASGVLRAMRESKSASLDESILDSFVEYQNSYPECLSYEKLSVGEGAQISAITNKLPDVDVLEVGKVGRVADKTREIVYVVDKAVRRKPKSFDEVRGEIAEEWLEQKILDTLEEQASEVKRELLNSGNWPLQYENEVEESENVFREEAGKVKNLPEVAVKAVFERLCSPKQVFKIVNKKDGAIILKLTTLAVLDEVDKDDGANVYTEKVLEEKLKNATIEEYLSGELGRYRKGRG